MIIYHVTSISNINYLIFLYTNSIITTNITVNVAPEIGGGSEGGGRISEGVSGGVSGGGSRDSGKLCISLLHLYVLLLGYSVYHCVDVDFYLLLGKMEILWKLENNMSICCI